MRGSAAISIPLIGGGAVSPASATWPDGHYEAALGLMFWFTWNKFVGSYFALT
jgi:hypothetical protein